VKTLLQGEPSIALCKLHHAPFDRHILGVRPGLIVEVRLDILRKVDGPMLKYGLQEVQGRKIFVPHADRLRPSREYSDEMSGSPSGMRTNSDDGPES
jgi:putative restriction endonuclease